MEVFRSTVPQRPILASSLDTLPDVQLSRSHPRRHVALFHPHFVQARKYPFDWHKQLVDQGDLDIRMTTCVE